MEDCVNGIRTWTVHHRLFIQSNKTEFIIIGSRQQLIKLSVDKLRVGDVNVSWVMVRCICRWTSMLARSAVRLFGVYIILKKIRNYLTEDSTTILVHAFIIYVPHRLL
jgi:hypothetical protein